MKFPIGAKAIAVVLRVAKRIPVVLSEAKNLHVSLWPKCSTRCRGFPFAALRTTYLVLALSGCTQSDSPIADSLPERLSDQEFWALIDRVSEDGGTFRSENLLSNERTFQFVIPDLASSDRMHRVYLGVGPEQNFTYIAALEPKMAIIVDVRRQNMMLHLMYKTLFELSADRAEFASRLFSRPRPPGLDTTTSGGALFTAYLNQRRDTALFRANLRELEATLGGHGFRRDTADVEMLRHVYESFFDAGPDIDYNYPRGSGAFRGAGRGMPSYAELMSATDSVGVNRSYLGDERLFRVVQALHARNLIIPVVGNFAGPKALRTVGDYLREHKATVAAIYTSNVEQYLFQQGDNWRKYYESVETLPLTRSTTFIRSIRPTDNRRTFGVRLVSTLSPTQKFLSAYRWGKIDSYADVGSVRW